MDVWNLILYVVASLMALKSLASLMTHHKKVVVQQLAVEYTQELSSNGKNASDSDSLNAEANPASVDQNASAA
jgi:arabinogalactan endo-1,4-beta-galactosidase